MHLLADGFLFFFFFGWWLGFSEKGTQDPSSDTNVNCPWLLGTWDHTFTLSQGSFKRLKLSAVASVPPWWRSSPWGRGGRREVAVVAVRWRWSPFGRWGRGRRGDRDLPSLSRSSRTSWTSSNREQPWTGITDCTSRIVIHTLITPVSVWLWPSCFVTIAIASAWWTQPKTGTVARHFIGRSTTDAQGTRD